jgi:hypothetical protein
MPRFQIEVAPQMLERFLERTIRLYDQQPGGVDILHPAEKGRSSLDASASSWFAETTPLTLHPALAVRITFYRLMALLIDPFQPTLALGEAETVVYY